MIPLPIYLFCLLKGILGILSISRVSGPKEDRSLWNTEELLSTLTSSPHGGESLTKAVNVISRPQKAEKHEKAVISH